MGNKTLFNVDKLKMSYLQPNGLFESIAKHVTGDDIRYQDFYLKVVDDGRNPKNPEKPQTHITALAITSDGELMGQLTLHCSDEFERRAFFEFDNRFLYSGNANRQNNEPYWDYAAERLGLELSTITQIDIACDTTKNMITRVRRLVRDWEHYDMILNGKKIIDENEIIDDYNLNFGTSRVRMSRTPTLYYRQANDDGLKERIYNKSDEIRHKKNAKKYIEVWDDMGEGKTIYRAEVQICWKMLKKWFEWLSDPDAAHQYTEWARRENEDWSHYIQRTRLLMGMAEYRAALWVWASSKLVYWRSKSDGERIDQADLID
jgi:hypothetical protein